MNFELVVAKNCIVCERTEKKLRNYSSKKDFIVFKTASQEYSKHNTTIVPSLFINGKLFSYGDVDLDKLEKRVLKLKD